jgi:hypothetical protein
MVIDERTGRLIIGHGRREALQAMRERGDAPPDGVTADWCVPVVRGWSSKSDAEADAAAAADNRLTEVGGWDEAELAAMLSGMEQELAEIAAGNAAELARLEAEAEAVVLEDGAGTPGGGGLSRCPKCGFEWRG